MRLKFCIIAVCLSACCSTTESHERRHNEIVYCHHVDLLCGSFERVLIDKPRRLRERIIPSVPIKRFTGQHLQSSEPVAPRSPLTPEQWDLFKEFENWRTIH